MMPSGDGGQRSNETSTACKDPAPRCPQQAKRPAVPRHLALHWASPDAAGCNSMFSCFVRGEAGGGARACPSEAAASRVPANMQRSGAPNVSSGFSARLARFAGRPATALPWSLWSVRSRSPQRSITKPSRAAGRLSGSPAWGRALGRQRPVVLGGGGGGGGMAALALGALALLAVAAGSAMDRNPKPSEPHLARCLPCAKLAAPADSAWFWLLVLAARRSLMH